MNQEVGELGSVYRWVHVLRDVSRPRSPARPEGLEFIQSTDPGQFMKADWGALLVLTEYFLRTLELARQEPDFLAEWETHLVAPGDPSSILLGHIAEVAETWLRRLTQIEAHHHSAGTLPAEETGLPGALFLDSNALGTFIHGSNELQDEGMSEGFSYLRILTGLAIADAAVQEVMARVSAWEAADGGMAPREELNAIATAVTRAVEHAPVALRALDLRHLAGLDSMAKTAVDRATSLPAPDEASGLRPQAGDEMPPAIVDPQLVCDLTIIRAATALRRAVGYPLAERGDFQASEAWDAFRRWVEEGQRVLNHPGARDRAAGFDLRGTVSWVEPNFGREWPACITDVEAVARVAMVRLIAQGRSSEANEARTPAGWLRIRSGRASIHLRVPSASALPRLEGVGGGMLATSFGQNALQTWLLFPSDSAVRGLRFWTDAPDGRCMRRLEELSLSPLGPRELFQTGELMSLTRGLAEPLLQRWKVLPPLKAE